MAFFQKVWSAETNRVMTQEMTKEIRISNTIIDYTKFTKNAKANGYSGPYLGGLQAYDVPVDAANFTKQSQQSIDFSFDQKKAVPVLVESIDEVQSTLNLRQDYAKKTVVTLLDEYDKFNAKTLISGAGTKIKKADSTGNKLSHADFIAAKKALNVAKAPRSNRYFACNAEDEAELTSIDAFISRDKLPNQKSLESGVVGMIEGFKVFLHNDMVKVDTAGTINATPANNTKKVNIAYQSNATGWGRNIEFTVKTQPDAGRMADMINTMSVFGGTLHKANHIVTVRDNVIS